MLVNTFWWGYQPIDCGLSVARWLSLPINLQLPTYCLLVLTRFPRSFLPVHLKLKLKVTRDRYINIHFYDHHPHYNKTLLVIILSTDTVHVGTSDEDEVLAKA